uniref:ANK_REP_REGION domain-containing protein n=1 Tax=Heligmosomoides polygyrus TaxID=6339 RepID=A0A183GKA1_HELPZ
LSANRWTALHWAARRGHTNICLLLLESGFSEELKDRNNKTPWEVGNAVPRLLCRSVIHLAYSGRRCSADSNQNTRFVPNYIRHPPFPYSKASSFDNGTLPVRMTDLHSGSPTTNGPGLYSYGRRDSVNRTRFLLVRTCCADGKEAFKRVTLPGGSTLAQLKKMIEKSMRNGEVKSIVTLPDRVSRSYGGMRQSCLFYAGSGSSYLLRTWVDLLPRLVASVVLSTEEQRNWTLLS